MKNNIFKLIISKDHESIRQLLFEQKAVVNETDKMGRSPLMEAVIQCDLALCKLFVQSGVNLNAKDNEGWTALHFAAQAYDCDVVSFLIENGAEIDAEDHQGNTPLFRCLFSSRGHGDVIRLFLQHGANKHHKNSSDISPMDLALQVTNFDLKKFFVESE